MSHNIGCDEFIDRLPDLLERDVDEVTRAAMEAHGLSCADCGALLADMRKLRIEASNLPALAPSRDLWDGIARRIDAPVIPLRTGDAATVKVSRTWRRWAPIAAAAVLLIAVTATSTYYLTIHRGTPLVKVAISESRERPAIDSERTTPTVVAPASDSTEERAQQITTTPTPSGGGAPVAKLATNKKPSAEQVYSSEISRLRTIVNRRRSQLDPVTISVIERNLKVIDEAIAQCRLALAKDPASRFLMESLNNALETKVELLRTATMLPARS